MSTEGAPAPSTADTPASLRSTCGRGCSSAVPSSCARWISSSETARTLLGRVLGHHARGRYDDAIAEGRRAVALDPVSPSIRAGLGHMLLYARRYDEAVEACTQALELEPDFVPAHFFFALTYHLTLLRRFSLCRGFNRDLVAKSLQALDQVASHLLGREAVVVIGAQVAIVDVVAEHVVGNTE